MFALALIQRTVEITERALIMPLSKLNTLELSACVFECLGRPSLMNLNVRVGWGWGGVYSQGKVKGHVRDVVEAAVFV